MKKNKKKPVDEYERLCAYLARVMLVPVAKVRSTAEGIARRNRTRPLVEARALLARLKDTPPRKLLNEMAAKNDRLGQPYDLMLAQGRAIRLALRTGGRYRDCEDAMKGEKLCPAK